MPSKTQSILLGGGAIGVAAALLSLIPIAGGCLACLTCIAAGVLAVWHYTDTYNLTITGGQGAGMGALAGIVALVVSGLIGFVFQAIGLMPSFSEAFEQGVSQGNTDPEQAEQIIEFITGPAGIATFIVVGLILYSILGMIGGVIGASVFKKGGTSASPAASANPTI